MESKNIRFNPSLESEGGKLYRQYCEEKGIDYSITAGANFCLGYMAIKPNQGPYWVKASVDNLPLHKAFWNIEDGFKKVNSFPVRIDECIYGMGDIYDDRQSGASDPIYYFVIDGKDYYENEFHRIEWLDEQPAAEPKPTFWDVAKAFKWAAEYGNEKGENLVLTDDGEWLLFSQEDGVTETEELTPGNVAELYCLQCGFEKENTPTPAGREEDARCAVFVPCTEDDIDCCGGYTSNDGRSLCYVKEVLVPSSAFKQQKEK